MNDELHDEPADDVARFTALVLRHQEMAFGYALAILRDSHLAQDATQEAFIAAYSGLATLGDRDKFPQWLRGIVRHQCWRILRRQRMTTVVLDEAHDVPSGGRSVEEETETREGLRTILAALDTLPEALRLPTILFYVGEHSQREIAAFLDLPVTKVNNRIHAARQLLKERRLIMPQNDTTQHPLPAGFAETIGRLVGRRGALIEARFPAEVPPILNALTLDAGSADAPTISVIQHLPGGIVRGILDRETSLATGSALTDTGQPSTQQITPRALAAILAALDTPTTTADPLETGIKALDLFCPLPQQGTVVLLGDMGVGKAVLFGELVQNLADTAHRLTMVTGVQPGAEVPFFQSYVVASTETIQQVVVAIDQEALLAAPELGSAFATHIYLTRTLAALGLYPAVDPARSDSRLLSPAIVGEEHYGVALATRDLLARYPEAAEAMDRRDGSPESRARRLRRFLSQPFFLAEPFTHVPGERVPRMETVRGCAAIMAGEYDALPEAAFVRIGRIEQAIERARALAAGEWLRAIGAARHDQSGIRRV